MTTSVPHLLTSFVLQVASSPTSSGTNRDSYLVPFHAGTMQGRADTKKVDTAKTTVFLGYASH